VPLALWLTPKLDHYQQFGVPNEDVDAPTLVMGAGEDLPGLPACDPGVPRLMALSATSPGPWSR